MRTNIATLSLSASVTTICGAGNLIGFDDAVITEDDAPVKGVTLSPVTEAGLDVAVLAVGVDTVYARGVINQGDKLISAAEGGVKAAPADATNIFATALSDAADGAWVKILIR